MSVFNFIAIEVKNFLKWQVLDSHTPKDQTAQTCHRYKYYGYPKTKQQYNMHETFQASHGSRYNSYANCLDVLCLQVLLIYLLFCTVIYCKIKLVLTFTLVEGPCAPPCLFDAETSLLLTDPTGVG